MNSRKTFSALIVAVIFVFTAFPLMAATRIGPTGYYGNLVYASKDNNTLTLTFDVGQFVVAKNATFKIQGKNSFKEIIKDEDSKCLYTLDSENHINHFEYPVDRKNLLK